MYFLGLCSPCRRNVLFFLGIKSYTEVGGKLQIPEGKPTPNSSQDVRYSEMKTYKKIANIQYLMLNYSDQLVNKFG